MATETRRGRKPWDLTDGGFGLDREGENLRSVRGKGLGFVTAQARLDGEVLGLAVAGGGGLDVWEGTAGGRLRVFAEEDREKQRVAFLRKNIQDLARRGRMTSRKLDISTLRDVKGKRCRAKSIIQPCATYINKTSRK